MSKILSAMDYFCLSQLLAMITLLCFYCPGGSRVFVKNIFNKVCTRMTKCMCSQLLGKCPFQEITFLKKYPIFFEKVFCDVVSLSWDMMPHYYLCPSNFDTLPRSPDAIWLRRALDPVIETVKFSIGVMSS